MSNEKRASKFSWSPLIIVLKRNSIELKYYEGEHYKYFAPKTPQIPFHSMYSYIRVTGNRKIFEKFIRCSPNQKIQFVNLGSGLDITSLWILEKFKNAVCFDLDLESQIRMKVNVIKNTQELLNMFPEHTITDTTFHSDKYHILPCDFRNLDELDKLKEFGFSSELPTIYLSEFVLTYVENHLSNKVISKCTTMSKAPSIFINHEHVINKGPIYEAGRIALKNNKTPVYTVCEYPNVEAQANRYKSLGWDDISVLFYTHVYNYIFDKDERIRVTKIEDFKEFHTLGLYCSSTMFGVATKNCDALQEFVKMITVPKTSKVEEGDPLIPHFSEDELDKEEPGPFLKFVEGVFEVTYSTRSEECQRYYRRF